MTLNKVLFVFCLFMAALTAVLQVWAVGCLLIAVYLVRIHGDTVDALVWAAAFTAMSVVGIAKAKRPFWLAEARKWGE